VGTVKKSRATRSRTWLARNVRQVCEGGGAALREEPGDGALGHVEAELQQLTMDSRSAPERIGRGHSCDKGRDLRVDRRAASGGPTGEFGPVLTETAPLPPQNGVGK